LLYCSWPLRSYSSMDVQVNSEKDLRQLQRENSSRLLQRLDSQNKKIASQNKQLSSLISSLRSEREEKNKEIASQNKQLSSLISSLRSEREEDYRPGFVTINKEVLRRIRRGSSRPGGTFRRPVDQKTVVVDLSAGRVSL
jgi:chromosome segregation ATPase